MKFLAINSLLWAAEVFAANIVMTGDGAKYWVSEWSDAATLVIPSVAGPVSVQKRTMETSPKNGDPDSVKTKLTHVWSIADKLAIFDYDLEDYLVISGKIAGLHSTRTMLHLTFSRITEREQLETVSLEQILCILYEGLPNASMKEGRVKWNRDNMVTWDLGKIFGYKGFTADEKNNARPKITVKGSRFNGGDLIVDIESEAKRKLQLTIDSSLNIVKASVDGIKQDLLLTGNSATDVPFWLGPTEVPIVGYSRGSTIQGCMRSFAYEDEKKGTESIVALLGKNGEFWIGPKICRLAAFGESLVGIKMDGFTKLQYFVGDSLPETKRSVMGFEAKLKEFDDGLPTFRYSRSKTIDLTLVFSEMVFADSELRIISIDVDDSRLKVILGTSDARTRLVLVFGPQMALVSASIVRESDDL